MRRRGPAAALRPVVQIRGGRGAEIVRGPGRGAGLGDSDGHGDRPLVGAAADRRKFRWSFAGPGACTARQAWVQAAEAIVVCSHGGRQLDGAPATAAVLPVIADAVDRRLEVLVDGGVRSGTDIVRMPALGAQGVLVGRPWVYVLAS